MVCIDNITWKLKNRKHGRPGNQASFLAVKVFSQSGQAVAG